MKKKLLFILFICTGFVTLISDSGIHVIEEPETKFHGIGDAKTLKLIKSVEEIAEKNLSAFTMIRSAKVDNDGNFYIFDSKHRTIIKLDPELKFVKTIGGKGKDHGDFNFFSGSIVELNVGRDDILYFSNLHQGKILKYTLSGKYIDQYKVPNFKPFYAVVDEKGNFYLPSLKEHIIDIYDSNMKYKKSFVPIKFRRIFLFYKPQPCVIYRESVTHSYNLMYDLLSTGDLILINNLDLSIMIIDRDSGNIKKQFYAYEDYLLSEYKTKLYKAKEMIEKSGSMCAYSYAFSKFFIDNADNICLTFIDSHSNKFLYKFSSRGDLIQIYKVDASGIEGAPLFFHFKDNKFYAYSNYGIHTFK